MTICKFNYKYITLLAEIQLNTTFLIDKSHDNSIFHNISRYWNINPVRRSILFGYVADTDFQGTRYRLRDCNQQEHAASRHKMCRSGVT